jgi:hypothetical protein
VKRAHAITIAVLVAALGIGWAWKAGWRVGETRSAPEPQDTVYAMLNAARAGDVNAYLANFTGQMEAALRQSISETTEAGFAKYLKDSHDSLKGVAVSDPQPVTDTEAKVRVEYVYQDRNEAQTMVLEKNPSGWKISRVDGDERVKTLIPYGTPVGK